MLARAYRGHNAHSGFLIIDACDLCSVIVRDIVHVVQDLIRITLRDYRVGKASVPAGRFPLAAERKRIVSIAFTSAWSLEHVDWKFPIPSGPSYMITHSLHLAHLETGKKGTPTARTVLIKKIFLSFPWKCKSVNVL